MNWQLNRSMADTKEQTTAGPGKTFLHFILFMILNIVVVTIASILITPFILKAMNITIDATTTPEKIQDVLMNSPLAVQLNLWITIFGIWIFMWGAKKFENRDHRTFGFFKKDWFNFYGLGVSVAAILMVVIYLVNFALGGLKSQLNGDFSWIHFLLALGGFMLQGMSEEVMLRGYLMNNLAVKWGVPAAILLNSGLFSLLHFANPNVTILSFTNIFLAGIFFSLLFYVTDNMWLTGAAHSFWNFIMGIVLGVEVSGLTLPTSVWVTQIQAGKDLYTGGKFGFEGGLVVTIVMVIACALLVIYRDKIRTALDAEEEVVVAQ